MKTSIRRALSKAYAKVLIFYDKLTAKKVDVCLADFMLNRGYVDSLQFLLASRIIDVEDFCNNSNCNFEYTNTISKAAYPERDEVFFQTTNNVFIKLINSLKNDGFNDKYPIKLDKEYRITDGTHRIAICYQLGYFNIKALILKRKSKNLKSPDCYYIKNSLSSHLLENVYKKNNKIQEDLIKNGYCFCLYAEENNEIDIAKDMEALSLVREVLINNGKLLIKFVLNNPDYQIVKGSLVSNRVLFIEDLLKERHPAATILISKNCSEGYALNKKYNDMFC